MSQLLSDKDWADFKEAVNNFTDTFYQKVITWNRMTSNVDTWGEGTNKTYTPISLNVYLPTGLMRLLKEVRETSTGKTDELTLQFFISKKYLSDLGYLNSAGYFAFNPEFDQFEIDGLIWVSSEDSTLAQAKDDNLLFQVKLRILNHPTGEPIH